MKLFKNTATNEMFEVIEQDAENVRLAPQGGGFVINVTAGSFRRNFVSAELPKVLGQIHVTGDWLEGKSFPAYTDGSRWNGWATPKVTREVADALIAVMAYEGDDVYRFRWEGNVLMIFDPQEQEESPVSPVLYETTDGSLALYDLSLGWCWEVE